MTQKELAQYTNKQIENILICSVNVEEYVEDSLKRTHNCLGKSKNKYYIVDDFSVYHTVKYSIYLYYLSNTIYLSGDVELAEKVYYLNKVLHSVDWFYAIELPEYFGAEHPLGCILGRAKYSNGFFVYQGCTVGGNRGYYPKIGANVIMHANSTILGNCSIGNNVLISTGAIVKDDNIPSDCIVFGQSPNLIIKENKKTFIYEYINNIWRED